MTTVPTIASTKLSIREQAEAEVAKETNAANLRKMTTLIRQRVAAEQALAGINLQIADQEQRIADGTA
jgi:hypothetical protein